MAFGRINLSLRCRFFYKKINTQKKKEPNLQEKLIALCRHRGFIFPGSDIYGGLANSFDYGPLGTLLKKNIQDRWWFEFIQKRPNCLGLDSSILLNPSGEILCVIQ
jgi:glycyl-tRNA synthetase (class II)